MRRGSCGSLLILAALAGGVSGPAVGAAELWVVEERSRQVEIIDSRSETVIDAVDLSDRAESTWGLAFSSLPGHEGERAFVTQGQVVRVIDAARRVVLRDVDVAGLVGRPLLLRGCASSRPAPFTAPDGTLRAETYLFLAADANPLSPQHPPDPFYVVLDQRVLLDLAPPGTSPLSAAGPLLPDTIPPAERGRALAVTPLGAPLGNDALRAWFTLAGDGLIRAVLLATGAEAGHVWRVRRTVERSAGAAGAAPDSLSIGAPHDRELTLLPTGDGGRLENLASGRACSLPDTLGSAFVHGPAPGGYRIYVTDPAADRLLRVSDEDCSTTAFPTGREPVALTSTASFGQGPVYVAARGADEVDVLHGDGTLSTIALGPGGPTGCDRCPRSIAVRVDASLMCSVEGLSIDSGQDLDADGSLDDLLTWQRVGCGSIPLTVYCQCVDPWDPTCPCHCPASPPCVSSPPSTNLAAGSGGPLDPNAPPVPWKPLGWTLDDSWIHSGAGEYEGLLNYTVGP